MSDVPSAENNAHIELAKSSIQASAAVQADLISLAPELLEVATACCCAWERGGTVYVIGNGGSAAEAQHLAAELVGRFERDNCLAAQALTTDTSIITALANDFSFDEVYERQVRALVKRDDILIALSTSGNSEGILRAVEVANGRGALTVGLSGKTGGKLKGICKHCLLVPSERTCRIQEGHLTIIHVLCELIERLTSAR